jgi:PAS domain S-box-containing protein
MKSFRKIFSKILPESVPVLLILVPLMVLLGWSINNIYLTRILPAFTPMNPVTAISFLILGLYFLILSSRVSKKIKTMSLCVTAGALMILGGLMSLKYIFGIDLHIDRVFFSSELGINRMAPATAADLFLLGLSLLFFRTFRWIARALALVVTGVGLYSIAAYVYNFVGVYGHTLYNPVAIHTAILFVLSGMYLLVHEGKEGIFSSTRWSFFTDWFQNLKVLEKFLIGFGSVMVLVVLFSLYALLSVNEISRIYSLEQKSALEGQMALTLEVDTFKGRAIFEQFIQTSNPSYLTQLTAARAALATERDALHRLSSLPKTLELLNEYEAQLPGRTALSNQIIALVSAHSAPATYAGLMAKREANIVSSNALLEGIVQAEMAADASTISAEQNQVRTIEVNFIFLSFLVLFLILVLSIAITRSIVGPVTRLKEQAEHLAAGDFSARTRLRTHDEVGNLAQVVDNMAEILGARTKELQEAKAKDEAILSSIGDAVFAIDSKRNIISINHVAEAMAGIRKEDIMGKPYNKYLRFIHEESGLENVSFIRTALSGKKTSMENHTALLAGDGRRIPVADSASPLINDVGETIGAVVVFRDVTKEREIDQAKNEFVSLASHQLRTPLTSIKWYTELLLDEDAGKLTKEQKEYASEIQAAMVRMNDLVAALLDVSRLDLGTFIIEPKRSNLVSLLDEAAKEQIPTFHQNKQTFSFTHPDDLPEVLVDPKLLHIIVQNLLSNAHKYTPDGGTIKLALTHSKKNGYQIVCSDTGYGIPPSQQGSVFKKLFRADNIRTLDVEGTGLGLYIIKTIVDAAGCTISFTSAEGKGTTFTITIPTKGMLAKGGTKSLSDGMGA